MRSRAERNRVGRIRLLSAELATGLTRAIDRTRSIETKASFIAAAAGLVASATIPTVATGRYWFVAVVPLGLAVVTVIYAARALWPKSLEVSGARLLVDTYVDAEMTPETLEDHLLEVRAVEIEKRDESNIERTKRMTVGFSCLSLSLAALVLIAVLNATFLKGNLHDGETSNTPNPTQTSGPA